MKIEPKDIKKHLSLKGKIVVTAKYWYSLSKPFLKKVENGWKKIKPTSEQIQSKTESVTQNINSKIEELNKIKNTIEQDDEYLIEEKKCHLKEVKRKIQRLEKKQIKVSNKGLSVFALSPLILTNIKNKTKTKFNNFIKNKKEQYQDKKREQEIQKVKAQIQANLERLKELNGEALELLEKHPEFAEKTLDTTSTVTGVRAPSVSEQEKIKKSNNFKKACAAIAIVTGIAIGVGSIATYNNKKEVNKVDSIAQVDNTNQQIEANVEQQENIKLGDYITIDNGSAIYKTSELKGIYGEIGKNGYNSDSLFMINAITYVDENNVETSFNLVGKTDHSKKMIQEQHKKFIEDNKNIKVKNFHITPCDELGIPVSNSSTNMELGGWTNSSNSSVKKVETSTVLTNTYQNLGGKTL
ncbi:MAG: hypothetical protein E7166_02045 [Firmicutes bacterium]|nr:hypothetical protein [Bacillota bacterium]